MSILDKVAGQINEMFAWLDYQGINVHNVAYVSPATLSDMLKESALNMRYSPQEHRDIHRKIGYTRLQLQTSHAVFFIDPDKTIEDGDLQLKDIDGFMHSYNNHYINEVIEQTILKGHV